MQVEQVWGMAKAWLKSNAHIIEKMTPAEAISEAMQQITAEDCQEFISSTDIYREF